MKRLLPSIICALALHAIILSSDFGWLKLAPSPAPASKTLSITLSADKLQIRKAQAAVANKEPEKRLPPDLQEKPVEKTAGIPANAQLKNSTRNQKRSPIDAPEKTRQKKNLKALTRKNAPVKVRTAIRTVSIDKQHVPPAAHTKIFSPLSSANKFSRNRVPTDSAAIKKTHRTPDRYSESMTSAATLSARQSSNSLSATAITLAKPLFRQNPTPVYPRKARRMGYEGIVMLKVLVDENGRVDDLTVLESSGHTILDQTALASVRKWLFEPGTAAGMKTKMWVRVPIRFDLE